MTQAETRFKFIVTWLIGKNIYPGATAIRYWIKHTWPGYGWGHDDLNGRQCKWRDDIYATLPEDHWVRVQHRKNGGIELRGNRNGVDTIPNFGN